MNRLAVITGPGNPLNPVDGVTGIVHDLFGGASSALASAVLDALSSWVAKGTAGLVGSMAEVLDHETRPDLGAAWFHGQYVSMGKVALLLAVPLLFAAAISSIIHQDFGPLIRATFVHLPLAGLGTGVAVSLTSLALGATDSLCGMVTSGTGANAHALFAQISSTLGAGIPGAPGFGTVLVALVVAVGAFLLTLELIVRSAAVYVAMLFLPLALSGLVWPATARWGKRLAELLTALIVSKFVMVAVISMAVAALSAGTAGQGMSGLLTGAALMLLAAVAPFVLLRMAPIVEAGAVSHLDGAGRRMATTPQRAFDAGEREVDRVARVLSKVNSEPPGGATGDPIPVNAARVTIGDDGTQGPAGGPVPQFAGVGAAPVSEPGSADGE